MSIVILIPALACVIALFRGSVQKAFLDVYLPVFMLFPIYYFWKGPGLPPLDFSEAALLPIGVAIIVKELPRWRLSTMDLWMAFFLYSSNRADANAGLHTASIFELFTTIMSALVPYAVGKLLIEQPDDRNIRIATVRRFLFLLFVACIISAYEYRLGQNPFMKFWGHFFPGEFFAWKTQIRWGFGRVSGPYGQSELAGIMLLAGIVLALWFGYCHYWEPKFAAYRLSELRRTHLRKHPLSKRSIITGMIALTLLMTQARGPWLGSIFAIPVSFIGRSRRVLRTAILVGSVLVIGGGTAYFGLKNYVSDGPAGSPEQQTAQYREQLLSNYLPVAQEGGAWGWGQAFPHVGGQGSIDNEYLFLALTQGWVGLVAFCLLAFESVVRLTWYAAYSPTRGDRYFALSLMGIFFGLLITIFTVFLGLQPYQLFFLLAGWAQALRPRKADEVLPVFEHVYT